MKKVVIAAVVLGVLVAFGIGASVVLAQGPTPTPTVPGFPPMGGFGMWGRDVDWQTKTQEAIAKVLGITVDELNAEIRAGKTLAQIAQSKNISLDKVHEAVEEAHKALLQQAVKDGKLTQAQAAAMIQHMDAMDEWMDTNGGACPGWTGGFGYMPHGGMMGGGYAPNLPPAGYRMPMMGGGWYGNQVPPTNFRRPMMGGWR